MNDLRKSFDREMALLREKAARDVEDAKSDLTDLNRKLEQRFYRADAEKQAIKHAHEEEMDQLRSKHRAEVSQLHDEKHRSANELRKEYDQRVSTLYLFLLTFLYLFY